MTIRPSDYRKAGRYYQQDRAYAARRKAIREAEEAYAVVWERYFGANDESAYEEYQAAHARLEELDPGYFT